MADRLQWILDLQDRLSGPAARMERQLGQVRAQLKALDIQAKQNNLDKISDPLKRQRAELQLHRDKLLLSKMALEKTGQSARNAGHDAGFFTRQLHDILHIAQIVGGALERVAHGAADVGRDIAKSISFKQGSMIGLEAILGKGAGSTFERLEELAAKVGKPIAESVNLGRTLANVGVKGSDLEPMVKLIEDLDALDPGAGEKLAGVIRGIYSTGMMKSGDVEALRGTILKPEKIYEDIAARFGAGRNRYAGKAILDQEIGVGKNIGVSTLLAQVLGLEGGQAGSASGRRGLTLDSRLARVGTNIERMFSKLSGSPGVKAFSKLLDNLADLFNPSSTSGQATLQRLNQLSDVAAKFLEPLTGPEGKKKMQEWFDSFVEKTGGAIEKLKEMTGIFGTVLRGFDYILNPPGLKAAGTLDRLSGGKTGSGAASIELTDYAKGRLAERRFLSAPVISAPITVNVQGNASREDAKEIARAAKQAAIEAVTDALDRSATQQGGQ